MTLKEKVIHNLNENVFHSIGDRMDNGGSSFLKGLAAGGLALAAFSDPETAHHVKEAIAGTAHNIGRIFGGDSGDQHTGALSKIINHSNDASNVAAGSNAASTIGSNVNFNNPEAVVNQINALNKLVAKNQEAWNQAYSTLNPAASTAKEVMPYAIGAGATAGLVGVNHLLRNQLNKKNKPSNN